MARHQYNLRPRQARPSQPRRVRKRPFPVLALPSEIRDAIWAHALPGNKIIDICECLNNPLSECAHTGMGSTPACAQSKKQMDQLYPALPLANRQIYQETHVHILPTSNTTVRVCSRRCLVKFLGGRTFGQLKNLRSIRLNMYLAEIMPTVDVPVAVAGPLPVVPQRRPSAREFVLHLTDDIGWLLRQTFYWTNLNDTRYDTETGSVMLDFTVEYPIRHDAFARGIRGRMNRCGAPLCGMTCILMKDDSRRAFESEEGLYGTLMRESRALQGRVEEVTDETGAEASGSGSG